MPSVQPKMSQQQSLTSNQKLDPNRPKKKAPRPPKPNQEQLEELNEVTYDGDGILQRMDEMGLEREEPDPSLFNDDFSDTASLYEAFRGKEAPRGKNGDFVKDGIAKRLGLEGQRQGFYLLGEQDEYESDRHEGIGTDNQKEETDETYLSRTFQDDKTFEKDVPKELEFTKGQKQPKAMEKLRKMAVRSAKVIDEHAHDVTSTTVMVGGATAEMKERRDEKLVKLDELVGKAGPGDTKDFDDEIDKEKDKLKESAAKYKNWQRTHEQMVGASAVVSDKADTAYKTSQFVDESEKSITKDTPLDWKVEESARKKVEVSLEDRKETKRHQTAALRVQDEMKKDELLDDGFLDLLTLSNKNPHGYKSKGKGLWEKGKGKVKGAIVGALFGGFAPVEEMQEVQGGRKSELKRDWAKPITNLKNSIKEAEKLRKSGAMGGRKASAVYAMLKVLSEGVIPMVRDILTSVGIWCAILAFFTLGGTAPVAAAAGALSLFLTLFKLGLDFGLFVWSAVKSSQHKDHDHRKNELATGESYNRFVDVALGGTKVGMGVGIGTNSNGRSIGPDNLMKNRVEDLKGNYTDTRYGSTGIKQGGMGNTKFKSPMGTHEVNTDQSLTTDFVLSGPVGGGMIKGMNVVNNKMIKGGGVKNVKKNEQKRLNEEGNQQLEKRQQDDKEHDDQITKEHQEALDRPIGQFWKVHELFGNLPDKMESGVKKADPKKLKDGVDGDPMEAVKAVADIGPIMEEFKG